MDEPVLIVGAGPTGLTLGIELARHGVASHIVEKRAEPSATSRALAVFARTLEQFDRMNLAERLVRRGRILQGATVHADGREIAQISSASLDSPFNYILSVPQSETEIVLEEEARQLGVRIDRELELTDIEVGDDFVHVEMRNAKQQQRTVEAAWVVGCDGAHSTVRHRLGIEYEGEDIDRWFMFADAKVDWRLCEDRLNMFLSPEGIAAAIPLPEAGLWRVIVTLPEGEAAPQEPTLAQINDIFSKRSGVNGTMRDARWLTSFTIRQRLAKRFRVGRVLLAGDAVHSHSPAGGQGMNTGVQDAGNLGWKLALVVKGLAEPALLDTYEQERQPVARAILRGTGALTKAATLTGGLSQTLRNQIAHWALQFDFVEKRVMDELSELHVGYRRSPLSMNIMTGLNWLTAFHRGPQVGERAPIVALRRPDGIEVRFGQLIQSSLCTALIYVRDKRDAGDDAAIARIQDWIDAYPDLSVRLCVITGRNSSIDGDWGGATRLVDADGEANYHYGNPTPYLYGIRPDGVIGLRATSLQVDFLVRWVQKVLGRELQS